MENNLELFNLYNPTHINIDIKELDLNWIKA